MKRSASSAKVTRTDNTPGERSPLMAGLSRWSQVRAPWFARCCAAAFALVIAAAPQSGAAAPGDSSPDGVWQQIDPVSLPLLTKAVAPLAFGAFELSAKDLEAALAQVPMEFTSTPGTEVIMTLPMPDGSFSRFRIEETPLLSADLQAQHPDIKTYIGQGIDDPTATARLDLTMFGFRGMVLSANGSVFIDPNSFGDTQHYVSYWKKDLTNAEEFTCGVGGAGESLPVTPLLKTSGDQLRTYDMVITATGEYTEHWGSVAAAVAQIVTTVNRVTGVYEREVAVRFTLMRTIVFTDSDTDPFPTGASVDGDLLNQNQTVTDDSVGAGNYDIGHILSQGGGGGLAGPGPCTGTPARGGTSRGNPSGDPFDIDFVAHEVGHQLGGSHPFNDTTGSCRGGNRSAANAYEPGSGSTIMAYAGICGAANLQSNSDPYFHVRSLDQIITYRDGTGSGCGTVSSTGNNPPSANAGSDYTIPTGTSFTLTGSGSDPDGHPLTYCWEQFDLGDPSPPQNDANGPLFRSFSPTTDPSRTLPNLVDILEGNPTPWEYLPTVDRGLTFRLSVRDNRAGGGGVDWDEMNVTVAGAPFEITYPNGGETIAAGCPLTITWNVGGGSIASNVDILLSLDGGITTLPLVSNTANDGSATVDLPCTTTTEGRIWIVPVGDFIFFDVSDDDFNINLESPDVTANAVGGNVGANCTYSVTFTGLVTDDCAIDAADVDVDVSLLTGNASLGTPIINKIQDDGQTVSITGSVLVSNLTGSPATVQVRIEATDDCNRSDVQTATANVYDVTSPDISASATGGAVDENCEFLVTFNGTVTDNCFANSGDVSVTVSLLTGNATLAPETVVLTQIDPSTVGIAGSVLVSELTGSPATVEITINADDATGNSDGFVMSVDVIDPIPLTVTAFAFGGAVDDHCEFLVTFDGTVDDNCPITVDDVIVDVTLLTGNAILDPPVINKTQTTSTLVTVDGSVLVSALTGSPATVQITITGTDAGRHTVAAVATADVIDLIPPVITCPDDITAVFSSPTEATITWEVTATDNCDPDPDITSDPPSGATYFIGTTHVTSIAVDDSYNADTCDFSFILVPVDIKPRSCPNPLSLKTDRRIGPAGEGSGLLPVAILGTASFDVSTVDPSTITLSGIAPLRWEFEDVSTPVDMDSTTDCECTTAGPDGLTDLTLKFSQDQFIATLDSVATGDVILPVLTGRTYDGTPIAGSDCLAFIVNRGGRSASTGPWTSGDEGTGLSLSNYPNPFNASTSIRYRVPEDGRVDLAVYNVLGQRVRTLVDADLIAGEHTVTWDSRDNSGKPVPSGMYLYRLETKSGILTEKMSVLK